jgi:predicted component of type VI protein secretion system
MLKLGRGHESDVRIADVSISRCHATIRYSNGSFLLEDNNSKFGTLVAMKKPRLLEANAPISIQMGRTVLKLNAHSQLDSTPAGSAFLPQLPDSSAEDERALRLSLMARGNSAISTDEQAAEADQMMHAVRTTASTGTNDEIFRRQSTGG